MGKAQGERVWKARDRKEMRRQGVACMVTGMHGNSNVCAGKPFPRLHTYFKDLLLHTKGRGRKGEGPARSRWEREKRNQEILGKAFPDSF